jgi:hypothetical protein
MNREGRLFGLYISPAAPDVVHDLATKMKRPAAQPTTAARAAKRPAHLRLIIAEEHRGPSRTLAFLLRSLSLLALAHCASDAGVGVWALARGLRLLWVGVRLGLALALSCASTLCAAHALVTLVCAF